MQAAQLFGQLLVHYLSADMITYKLSALVRSLQRLERPVPKTLRRISYCFPTLPLLKKVFDFKWESILEQVRMRMRTIKLNNRKFQ